MPPNTSSAAALKRAHATGAAPGLAFTPIRQRVLQLLLEHEKGLKTYGPLALIKPGNRAPRHRPSIARWIS